MKTPHPDIVVMSPDGEYLAVVEIKLTDTPDDHNGAVMQLKHLMTAMGCSVGLAVTGEQISLLKDSLEKPHGESIAVVGEATLPESLLPPADDQWKGQRGLEFESRVQRWLEHLKQTPTSLVALPKDLGTLLGEPIINLLKLGEIRAAGPRWSRIAS
jgi:hypothetical protein